FFDEGSRWYNTATNTLWICVSGTPAAAIWRPLPWVNVQFAVLSGDTVDFALEAGTSILEVTTVGLASLESIAFGTKGELVMLWNAGPGVLRVVNQGVTLFPIPNNNLFLLTGNVDLFLNPLDGVMIGNDGGMWIDTLGGPQGAQG